MLASGRHALEDQGLVSRCWVHAVKETGFAQNSGIARSGRGFGVLPWRRRCCKPTRGSQVSLGGDRAGLLRIAWALFV